MRVSVEDMLKNDETNLNAQSTKKNQFFALKKDGESAIVRFLHQDINDFDVLDIHNIKLGGYSRKINCLREGDNNQLCPLCMNNEFDENTRTYAYPIQRRFYIHLVQYNNPAEAVELVWDRSKEYIAKLKQLVDDYGPLCDRLYKIVRRGAEGSTDTTYDILPLDKDRFDPNSFVFDRNLLNYKSALGTVVLDKNAEEIKEYLATGNFPGFNGGQSQVTARPQVPQAQQIPVQPAQVNTFNQNTFTAGYSQPVGSASESAGETTVASTTPGYTSAFNNSFPFDQGPRRRV